MTRKRNARQKTAWYNKFSEMLKYHSKYLHQKILCHWQDIYSYLFFGPYSQLECPINLFLQMWLQFAGKELDSVLFVLNKWSQRENKSRRQPSFHLLCWTNKWQKASIIASRKTQAFIERHTWCEQYFYTIRSVLWITQRNYQLRELLTLPFPTIKWGDLKWPLNVQQ